MFISAVLIMGTNSVKADSFLNFAAQMSNSSAVFGIGSNSNFGTFSGNGFSWSPSGFSTFSLNGVVSGNATSVPCNGECGNQGGIGIANQSVAVGASLQQTPTITGVSTSSMTSSQALSMGNAVSNAFAGVEINANSYNFTPPPAQQ